MILSGTSGSTSLDSGSTSSTSQTRLQEDLNQFLNLLVTQLKNQDPLDPMDATEFTSQLVQFASVEQQIYANSHLETLVSLQKSSQTAFMVDYLGTTVEATGDVVMLQDDGAEFNYILESKAATVQLTIQNAAGETVFTTSGETGIGKHNVLWDGTNAAGVRQDNGAYTVVVTALDNEGNLLDVTQTVVGKVVGAGNDDGEPYLFVGEVLTPMDQIISVRETPTASGADDDETTETE